MAIEEARIGIHEGHGGPFGAVIVKDGKVIAKGHNRVLEDNNPTHHGEMPPSILQRRPLEHTTSQDANCIQRESPATCACMWANIDKIYYGCTIEDNGRIGFRDEKFDGIFGGREKLGDYLTEVDREECLKLFDEYLSLQHTIY